jgi:hypothetical protein
MSKLLREYMKLILTEAPALGQSSLTASKILGYAAEWATWESCGGSSGFIRATKEDRRIKPIWDAAFDKNVRKKFEDLYKMMVAEASLKVAEIRSNTNLTLAAPRAPDAGTVTEKVDVITKDADIHVKFNDAVRLAGFQRAKTEMPASKTSVIYDKVMRQFGNDLQIDPRFIDKNGFLRRPSGVKGMTKMSPQQRAAAEKLQYEFQDARDQYRLAFTNSSEDSEAPGYREEFITALDKAGIRKAILSDIRNQLLGASGKASIYFKYFSDGKSVMLEMHQYDLGDMVVTPMPGQSTKFYQVTNEDGTKIYFQIEFRLDGGGHPPQLKVGKDLDIET